MARSLKQDDGILLVASVLCMAGSLLSAALYFLLPPASNKDIEVLPAAVQALGKIRQGTLRTIAYSIVNRGSEPLTISEVVASCGCTTTSITKKDIPPGETSVVTLSYDSGQSRGVVRVIAHVIYRRISMDGSESLSLEAKGEIDPDYGINPERLQFKADKKVSQRLVVWPRHTKDLGVTNVTCDKRFFAAHIAGEPTGGQVSIDVTFDPSDYYRDAGPAQLSIATNSHVQPVAHVPIDVIH